MAQSDVVVRFWRQAWPNKVRPEHDEKVRGRAHLRLGGRLGARWVTKEQQKENLRRDAVLHIHDRDYVYVPGPDNKFKRIEVVSGDQLPGNMQEIKSGLKAGQQLVTNALVLERTIDQ